MDRFSSTWFPALLPLQQRLAVPVPGASETVQAAGTTPDRCGAGRGFARRGGLLPLKRAY
ncbi:hypothetical protein QRO11_19050 [Paracidovorax citrulli]|uniref:Uncharacterized protein n=1 Tax=Paracidovorax citrulli TaxID=80869 RepID=A0ABY9AMF7_PARCI|nr:hypothetical protein [Paracidovorax citrulli]UEG45554.1 hypothetical protein LKW27_18195 [Paracidovorax citrulli]UMT84737.1 hypothetical protein FRC75_15960 [Paracidovorax citrulli]UMT87137.1 hypothetical protein FRC90_03055 [Paracidovorax citrulli]UMT95180.1 hypothetical protein FRC97_09250 [Paracidovorax citrulli]WIY28547.1 hypothetical protein QRO09_15990 [Paracidovorax citrulli]